MRFVTWLWRLLTHRHTREYSVITSVVHQNTNGGDVYCGIVQVTSACLCEHVHTRRIYTRRCGSYALAASDVYAIVRVVTRSAGKYEIPAQHNVREVFADA